ncbi:MAG TPA: metal ABC transporter substrate-binding protein [Vicinamibacterales bacterium]
MKKLILTAMTLAAFAAAANASAAVKVVTTTQDLEAIVTEIGGDKVAVESIAKGYQDPHFVEAKPSFIIKLHSADLLVVVGRELEIAWLPALVTQSRNPKIQLGGAGYLDASQNVRILDIPTGQITRAMGDVHPSGNPHYWLDPANGRQIAKAVQEKLTQLSAGDAAYFAQRYADFDRRLGEAEKRWKAAMAPYKGLKIVTYHRSWTNFADAFGLNVVGYVEPKPGIPPSPAHTLYLQQEMKRQSVKILIVEPYFDSKTPNAIGRETGAKVLVLPPSVGGVKEASGYIQLFDYDVNLLVSAIKETGTR